MPRTDEPPVIANPIPREKLLTVAKTLPVAPRILAELGHKLRDLSADLSDVTELLKRDAALTARVLRIANSAVYGTGVAYSALEDALARIGYTEVYRMVGFAAIGQIGQQKLPFYGVTGGRLRENSLLTALIMEQLAPRTNVDPRAAYTAGLLRSTGKLVVDRLAGVRADAMEYETHGTGPLAEWESSFVGMNNCDVAALVLTEWHFPEEIVAAIRDHYLVVPEISSMACLLNIAANAAERGGHGLPGEVHYWDNSPERYASIGLDRTDAEEALRHALEKFGPVRAAVG